MKPIFHPHLVNKASGDPLLYIDFLFDRRAVLFDLGDASCLSSKKILRISEIFISHTHIDHFYGFDHLLRILLGRERHIRIFGPPGFIKNIVGKLQGYTWNLVENYSANLYFEVTEVHEDHLLSLTLSCKGGFQPYASPVFHSKGSFLLSTLNFQVNNIILDHGTPCLAFCLQEKNHLNVNKVRLQELDLPVGPWLKDLKEAVCANAPDNTLFTIPSTNNNSEPRIESLSLLRSVISITKGQKIMYVVDCLYNDKNREKILSLAQDSDYFFCEATFLERDRDRAAQRCHLTAHQAGILAREAKAKRLITFHFSPRYHGYYNLLVEEAINSFRGDL